MESYSKGVDQQHKSLLINLCEMMNPDNSTYKKFIFYLKSYISDGSLLTVQQNPIDVFALMEEEGILKVGEYKVLEEALNASGYIDILNVLKDGEKSIAARQMRKRSYSDGPMAGGSSNIETATESSIEPEESRNNISSPKIVKQNVTVSIADAKFCNIVSGDKSHSVINSSSVKEALDAAARREGNPTKEDISKLRDGLINAYKNLRCIPVSPIFQKMRCNIDNICVDLVITKKQDSRSTEENNYASTQYDDAQSSSREVIKVTSYKQIFQDERASNFKRVYLRGAGGLGKTTFCRKVLHAWCNVHEGRAVAHDGLFQDETVFKIFDLLFYLNLQEVSVDQQTLIAVIYAQIPFEEVPSTNFLETLLKLNGDKILFILDGLDEMIVNTGIIEKIVTCKAYRNCCFLVSSRPWKISQMELHEEIEIDLMLDLKGFSPENAIKCAEKLFENCYKDGNVIKQFKKDIAESRLARQLIHVPLLLLFLAHVWYGNNRSLPSKLHELYILFLNLMPDRMKDKFKEDPNHRQMRFTLDDNQSPLPSKISETSLVMNFGEGFLLSLCEVAHHFLLSSKKENSLVFEETKLLKVLGDKGKEKLDVALDLGILSVTDSVSYLNRKISVSFIHKTVQEFFTALYFIFNPKQLANFIFSIADIIDVLQNENIIVFLVGLMPKLGNSVLEKVNEFCRGTWDKMRSEVAEKMEYRRYINIHSSYFQNMLCSISKLFLRCKEEVIGDDVLMNVSGLYLEQKDFNFHPWNPAFLQRLYLMRSPCTDDRKDVLVDLRKFTGLTYLELHDLNFELYLPVSGSLSDLFVESVTLDSNCSHVLGRTLTHCTKLERFGIYNTNLHNCLLDLTNMTELRYLDMSEVTLSSSCCDVLGRTLTHCTKLERFSIHNTDLHNCLLDLTNMTELRYLDMSEVTLSSSCCDVLGRTLTHCTKLERFSIHNTDLHNCLLDLTNMTELRYLDMSEVTLSSSCCDVLGRTLTHCTKLERFSIHNTDLHNCLLDLTNMTELTLLDMVGVTLSSSCCDILGRTLTHCTKLERFSIHNTDLHNCLLDLTNMTELTLLDMVGVTLSSSCCDVLGRTLTHCTNLMRFSIHNTDHHNCLLDLTNMTKLRYLDMSELTLSSSCCDILDRTLTYCTVLRSFSIRNTDLHNCLLDLTNMTELRYLDMSEVTLSSSCCDVLGRTLTHCTKLERFSIRNTDLHNCLLDLTNMTKLRYLDMSEVTLSSSCCDVLGRTLTYCTMLRSFSIHNTDLHNCLLDLTNMTELRYLDMSEVTLSSSCCDVLGRTLTHCTKLERFSIHNTDLHNCLLDLTNMTELRYLDMSEVTLSSSCCDILGRTLTHCTNLKSFDIRNTDLHNCLLDLTNVTDLTLLYMSEVTLSSSCCDVLGRTLTHCTKLDSFSIHNTDLHNCLLDLSNMTELRVLHMSEVTLSSSCCDVLGRTLTHCTKLRRFSIHNTDLHNCLLDLTNMTELTDLDMSEVTLSISCCDVLGRTLTHCTNLMRFRIHNTDLHNCLLDLSNMTRLLDLLLDGVILSGVACHVLGLSLDQRKALPINLCNYTIEKSPCDNEKGNFKLHSVNTPI